MTTQHSYVWTGTWLIGIVAVVIGTYNLVVAPVLEVYILAGYRAIGMMLLGVPPPPLYLYDIAFVVLGWVLAQLSATELSEDEPA